MVFVAKESVCGQLGAAFRLRGFSCQRTVESCLILYGIEINENFSVRFDLSSRLRSIEAGGCVRVSRRGRGGAWRRGCTGSEQIDVRAFGSQENGHSDTVKEQPKVCLRCGMTYQDEDNSPIVCKYHGHMTGDPGLYTYAPPHQGIDGEWADSSGVIVYKWNTKNERPNTGSKNWKQRWTCCGVYDEDAAPCRLGRHVSYDDGATRF
ncbi:uncharacterized protein [Physcomitrium patens]|uniref:Uncharacterized protein n=1 Tax=Physcomitrium patens TaxID=3218 RepID=A0A2K1JGR6_PHYPA|nr:uncharacterized protein LOC112291050 isoform X2 [Physcomitrium patens]PNR40754.1 hypothetical protein PHYPA_018157 [Physcomitrium patens]|eukprot:XP_024393761.1 uncharacterized protein LOC112291050 isoform X2 [Physcomitrella patens]